MMKLKLASSFLFLLFLSCSVDYDLEPSLVNEPDRIIVDSYLSPDCPLQVQLFESVKTESGYVNRGLTQAHVILKEDQTTLFDGICTDSILRLDYQPHENAAYSIEVSHEGLATVSAQTCIPKAIHCNASFSTDGKYWDTSRYLVHLQAFDAPQKEQECLWITAYRLRNDNQLVQYNEIYTNHSMIDKLNSTAGMDVKNESVGSIYYNGFLRIKYKNIPDIGELVFTPNHVYNGSGEDQNYSQRAIHVKLITASPEYDRFNKSLYEQKHMIVNSDDVSSVFYQPKTVYTNVTDGLGIFAGYSEVTYRFNLPEN
jgi:hypothetical protein